MMLPLKLEWCGLAFELVFERGECECESDDSTLPVDCVEREWRVDRDCVDWDCVECGVECVCGLMCEADEILPRGRRNWNG